MPSSKNTAWDRLLTRWRSLSIEIETLVKSVPHRIADADVPDVPGVYIIIDERGKDCYVGKATKSLRDRVLRKHVSGDESHALQLAYMTRFPDRLQRRKFIRSRFKVKWLKIRNQRKIMDVERLLIALLNTRCNRG